MTAVTAADGLLQKLLSAANGPPLLIRVAGSEPLPDPPPSIWWGERRYLPEEDVWRVLIERDVGEVAYHLPDLRRELASLGVGPGAARSNGEAMLIRHERRVQSSRVADCEAWLARARAALEETP